jgi:hypothetical protein
MNEGILQQWIRELLKEIEALKHSSQYWQDQPGCTILKTVAPHDNLVYVEMCVWNEKSGEHNVKIYFTVKYSDGIAETSTGVLTFGDALDKYEAAVLLLPKTSVFRWWEK